MYEDILDNQPAQETEATTEVNESHPPSVKGQVIQANVDGRHPDSLPALSEEEITD